METNTLQREEMKFILNGRTFDTASSIRVAVSSGAYAEGEQGDPQVRFEHTAFRTAKGSFFIHEHSTTKFAKGKPQARDAAREVSFAELIEWIQASNAAVLDDTGLDFPEEA